MLAQTLGPGKAQVVVNANLNANQATSDTLTYGKKGVPLTRRPRPRRSRAAAHGLGRRRHDRQHPRLRREHRQRNSQLRQQDRQHDLRRRQDHHPRGDRAGRDQPARASSVLVDKSVPASDAAHDQAARWPTPSAFNAKRGDTISVGQLRVRQARRPRRRRPRARSMIGYAKYALVGFGALLFLFFMRAHAASGARARRSPASRPGCASSRPRARSPSLEAGGDEAADRGQARCGHRSTSPKRQVEELVERDPERVAQQVRAWMSED